MNSALTTSSMSAAPTPPSESPTSSIANIFQSVTLNPPTKQGKNPNQSPLQRARLLYNPRINPLLRNPEHLSFTEGKPTTAAFDEAAIHALFPNLFGQPIIHFNAGQQTNITRKKIAVVLSGGPAPGGHNVICGMYDFITDLNPENQLIGFLAGPDGLLKSKYVVLDAQAVAPFRNQGGFHMIGSGRTKIESPEQFAAARKTVEELDLDALVIVGGDDSNSNAMKLAENFRNYNLKCCVNGAPKTIDNDLRNAQVEVSFGFDTASKNYAHAIACLAYDAVSARKTYHFVRVMGRSASHIALECALQAHPNLCFIGEEVEEKKMTLTTVVDQVVKLIIDRANQGSNYGIVVLPEGLVEFMPDVEALISDINEILASGKAMGKHDIADQLPEDHAKLFSALPPIIADQLMLERDPHGNVQVAKIEAERLVIGMVSVKLAEKKKEGIYTGKFSAVPHYLGYEGRCALPTNFDANYTYGLGRVAAALCCNGKTGYIAALSNLTKQPEAWVPAGFPLTMMMNMERRKGHDVAVIKKMLVDLQGAAFTNFVNQRDSWRLSDNYRSPGASQFWGPVADDVTLSLSLEAAAKTQ